ncbi:hypothetical protein MNEG_3102 [Monoraphidium neglectum]|uniref:Rhodanese domain-containing protein n=1 Tax=Monoraphidium neglectum TaxID=145388 RepID=A0A0D2MQA9_9CHLO|nr:hypothetical protein MNEG_3102 [Monoraphidium neglectum]KIZ04855.1 hypothetical protein MNEG_3102 [Monoraphidium neglectum]|eukprot:XP_013903874.1 hypothetical protein MNEG_3102 [Monoraphidium neglectum]
MAVRMRAVNVQAVAKPHRASVKAPVARNLAFGLAASTLVAQPARAEDAVDAVDATVSAVTEVVKAGGSAVRSGIDLLGSAAQALKEGYDVASPYIQQGVEAVTPAVKEAVKVTSEVAGPAINKAVPIVQDTLTGVVKSSGVDLDAVAKTGANVAKTATDGAVAAKPVLEQILSFLSSSSPVELAEYGLGAVALYLLSPLLLGGLLGGIRGYAGDITAVQALEAINGDSNAVIVDIRTPKEKETSGIPDVPGGGNKLVAVEYATIEDKKLRGSLRDAGFIEAQVTAIQIASLKRLGRGSKVLLLDRTGSTAKTVAKELSKRGFGRVYVIDGGFDGRNGWVGSKLLVKPDAGAGLQPLPNITRTITSRRGLPAPSK